MGWGHCFVVADHSRCVAGQTDPTRSVVAGHFQFVGNWNSSCLGEPWELVGTLDTLTDSLDFLSPYTLDCTLLQPLETAHSAHCTAAGYQPSAGFGTSVSLPALESHNEETCDACCRTSGTFRLVV